MGCSVWHVPPAYDPVVADSYRRSGCETFCVVRHPLTRLWSQHIFEAWIFNVTKYQTDPSPSACSAEAFSEHIAKKKTELEKWPFQQDCHFVPQWKYIQDGMFCQHTL